MQRPVMDPMFVDDNAEQGRRSVNWALIWRGFWRPMRLLLRLLLIDPFTLRIRQLKIDEGPLASRLVRGLLYRIMFVPIVVVLIAAAMVYAATHWPGDQDEAVPTSEGIYYDAVNFLAEDGLRVDGWLIPVIDAKRVLEKKENALREKYPAVVLVHDFGANRQQLLPLAKPLHQSGMIVLAVAVRGSKSGGMMGHTFGLRESLDVKAALAMLKVRPFVDTRRIAVVGIGTGANAALLACEQSSPVVALVLMDPVKHFEQILTQRLGPNSKYLQWTYPTCKWAFEIAYHVDAEDLNLWRHKDLLRSKPVLLMDRKSDIVSGPRAQVVRQVDDFLRKHLMPSDDLATTR